MLAFTVGALLSTAIVAASAANPPQTCSSDSFVLGEQTLTARICVPASIALGGDGRARIPVSETFTTAAAAITHATTLEFQENGGALSHTLDDVTLAGLGLPGSLHLTIGYKPGVVRLEHALLTPGARALK